MFGYFEIPRKCPTWFSLFFLEAYLVNLHGTVLNTTYLFVSSVLIVNEPGLATSLHWKNG